MSLQARLPGCGCTRMRGSTIIILAVGSAALIALMPLIAARQRKYFTSKPDWMAKGMVPRASPPNQERNEISLMGVIIRGLLVQVRYISTKALHTPAKRSANCG